MNKIAVVIPSYNGAHRVRKQLQTLRRYDICALQQAEFLIVEDYCERIAHANTYANVAEEFGVALWRLDTWSNMHGAAQQAFEIAQRLYDPEWIVYLGDDVFFTPYALSNLLHFITKNDLRHVGLVQPAYWNLHDLQEKVFDPLEGQPKNAFWTEPTDWLLDVPRNPHWDAPGYAHPYVNVNGCGFAAHADTYRTCGGIANGTWCLDESLSYNVWRRSKRGIVCLPGPPLVHYFGAATETGPPPHRLWTEEAWIEAMGCTKSQADHLERYLMETRQEDLTRECRNASYFKVP